MRPPFVMESPLSVVSLVVRGIARLEAMPSPLVMEIGPTICAMGWKEPPAFPGPIKELAVPESE